MDKKVYVSFLLAFYGSLLTEKQRQAIDLHYNYDLSLAEIADDLGGTRQSVNDSIKKGIACLNGFEEKMHCLDKYQKMHFEIEECKKALNVSNGEQALKHLDKIGDIWEE